MNSLMLDLETLSTEPDAAVLSVGVAIFDETSVIEAVGWAFDLELVHGHIDMQTLKWWMDSKRDNARAFSFSGSCLPFTMACELKTLLTKHNPQEYWANDPEFDLVVFKQWWRRQNSRASPGVPLLGDYPFGGRAYQLSRSYRTIMAECVRCGFSIENLKGRYVAHDPIEDASAQARAVIEARALIKGQR